MAVEEQESRKFSAIEEAVTEYQDQPKVIGGFEEMLMDVVPEESNAEKKVILSDDGFSNTEGSCTDSEILGLEVPQCYAIDMDISETMGAFKRRADEALSSDVLNFKVTVLSDKELSDSETLQQLCGTEAGLIRIQFVLCRDTQGARLDILDVLKHENDGTSASNNEANTLEQRMEKFKSKCDKIINYMKYGPSSLKGLSHTDTRNIKNASKTHLWDGEKEELYYIGGKEGVKKKVVTSVEEAIGIMRLYHPNPDGTHCGINRTLAKISQTYFWHGMRDDITGYIRNCEQCQRDKSQDQNF